MPDDWMEQENRELRSNEGKVETTAEREDIPKSQELLDYEHELRFLEEQNRRRLIGIRDGLTLDAPAQDIHPSHDNKERYNGSSSNIKLQRLEEGSPAAGSRTSRTILSNNERERLHRESNEGIRKLRFLQGTFI